MWKLIYFFVLLAYTYAQSAVVYLFDPSGAYNVKGNITFTKTGSMIHLNGTITGLAAGYHGFHIHELGNIAEGCMGTKGHFNPHKLNHGAPGDDKLHVGDLGNIVAGSNGIVLVNVTNSVIALEGEHNIIGRALVVHEGRDDLGRGGDAESLLTGNAGKRVACGVIGTLNHSATTSYSIVLIVATFVFSLIFCFE